MLNKAIIASMIFVSSSTLVFANAKPYVGAGISGGDKSTFNMFGGYGATLGINQRYYLGGELRIEKIGYNQLRHLHYGISASLLPGIYINKNVMAYTRMGIETTHYSGLHGTTTNAQLGLGLQANVAKKWDVRGEYVRTNNINDNQYGVGLLYKFE